jgi:hypothetical protein
MIEIHEIARIAHEINRAYCQALGDLSVKVWEEAPNWQQESAIKGVEFHLANANATPAASHDAWLAEKERTGWRYGAVKDEETKTHPCYVPFDELPPEQKAKDYLFQACVHALKDL